MALLELIDPAADSALAQVEDLAQRSGQPRFAYLAASRRAACTLLTGNVDDAERQIAAAAELADALGEPDGPGVRWTQLLALGFARGGAAGAGTVLRSLGPSVMPPEFAPQETAFRHLADGDTAAGRSRAACRTAHRDRVAVPVAGAGRIPFRMPALWGARSLHGV